MFNSRILLGIATVFIIIGLVKPNLNGLINNDRSVVIDNITVISPPQDKELRTKCSLIIDIFRNSNSSSRVKDSKRLSDLYMDLATLIELDGENEVVKTTEEIRQANVLSGMMLRMNIQGKYPGLADAAQTIVISQIGDEAVVLDSELRQKAVNAFRALSWACYEGAK